MTTSIKQLVLQAAPEPSHLEVIYGFVLRMRPGTAKETIRARVYEAMDEGKMLRLGEGIYIAVGEKGSLLVVQGDAWEALEQLDESVVDLIISDPPYDLGTSAHHGIGTTRPAARGTRDYPLKDIDERWLRAAFRALKKAGHRWRNMRTGQDKDGPGALVLFTPKPTRHTRRAINALFDLAEEIGFVYHAPMTWNKGTLGMGYSFGRVQTEHLHLLTAGPRPGVGHDLAMPDIILAKPIRNPGGGEGHEAQKPSEVFLSAIRFCCKPGDVVVDPFFGDSTWAKPAAAEGYHVIGVELNPKWVEKVSMS